MIYKTKIQIIPEPFSVMGMGRQRYAFFNQSCVIKDLDFRGVWVSWDNIQLCITFIFGVMQFGNYKISQNYLPRF